MEGYKKPLCVSEMEGKRIHRADPRRDASNEISQRDPPTIQKVKMEWLGSALGVSRRRPRTSWNLKEGCSVSE